MADPSKSKSIKTPEPSPRLEKKPHLLQLTLPEPPPKDSWETLEPSVVKGPLVLNDSQQKLLEEFKELIKDVRKPQHDDSDLCRWLVAREWDLKKAQFMYTESMKWREKEGMDTILETQPTANHYFDLLMDYWPHSILSGHRFYSRDGWPVVYEKFGKLDLDLVDLMPLNDLISFHMYTVECVEHERRRCQVAQGRNMGIILIQDLDGLGLDHIGPNGVKVFKQIAKVDQDNFPEGLRKVYFVNTPKIFQMAWKLVKSAIDEGVVAKFNFFGEQEEYLPELKKVISEDNIPKEYGGKADVTLLPGGSVKKYRKFAKELKEGNKN